MRSIRLVLPVLLPLLSGCAALVADSGRDVAALTTQAEVQQCFGRPTASGSVGGQPYEEFQTRRKIAEHWKVIYYCMGDVVTLGLGEVVWLPAELYLATRGCIVGRTVRFVYDEQGIVKIVAIDGELIPYGSAPKP